MDRALAHTETTVKNFNYLVDPLGKWIHNIPFEVIPEGFIKQLRDCPYSYEQYKKLCPTLNELPTYWNLVLIDDEDNVLVFVWGTYDPLEKIMHVVRCSIHPSQFKFKGALLERIVNLLKDYALALQLKKVYWITEQWKVFLRKLPGIVNLSDSRVVEVY